jgi:hypothetical protein
MTSFKTNALPSTSPDNPWAQNNRYNAGNIPTILGRVPMHEPWGGPQGHEHVDDHPCAPATTAVVTANSDAPSANTETIPLNPASPADWTKDTEFINRVKKLATTLGADYLDILAVMWVETNKTMNPNAKNPGSSATGLIQFLETTIAGLSGGTVKNGKIVKPGPVNTGKLAAMTRVDQMYWVEQYFNQYKTQIVNAYAKSPSTAINDLYMAVFSPVGLGKPDDFPLYSSTDANPANYAANAKVYDRNNDGKITKLEASAKLASFRSQVKAKLGV